MTTKSIPIPEHITHIGQLKNSDYLGAFDIPTGKTVNLVIKSIQMDEVHNPTTNKKEIKDTLAFEKTEKRLLLNVGKRKAIASWYGPNFRNWVGKTIELKAGTTKFQGKQVECIDIVADNKAATRNASAGATAAAE